MTVLRYIAVKLTKELFIPSVFLFYTLWQRYDNVTKSLSATSLYGLYLFGTAKPFLSPTPSHTRSLNGCQVSPLKSRRWHSSVKLTIDPARIWEMRVKLAALAPSSSAVGQSLCSPNKVWIQVVATFILYCRMQTLQTRLQQVTMPQPPMGMPPAMTMFRSWKIQQQPMKMRKRNMWMRTLGTMAHKVS